jgi:hypothetical protein
MPTVEREGMELEKNQFLHWKLHLQAIPVCLAALAMWAILGGWYVAVAPANMAGQDNFGIVISTLGLCLFLCDRLAYVWFQIHNQVFVFATWVWGLGLILWGLIVWLRTFSRRYIPIFVIHWLLFLIIIVSTWLWIGRHRDRPD